MSTQFLATTVPVGSEGSSFFLVTFPCVRSALGGSGSSPSALLLPAAPAPQPRRRVRHGWDFVEERGAREEVALLLALGSWSRRPRREGRPGEAALHLRILPVLAWNPAPLSLFLCPAQPPHHTHPLPAQAALPFEPEAYCQGRVESSESRNVQSIVWETAPEKPQKDLWAHDDTPSFLLKNISMRNFSCGLWDLSSPTWDQIHSRAIPSSPLKLEWKIGLPWANT